MLSPDDPSVVLSTKFEGKAVWVAVRLTTATGRPFSFIGCKGCPGVFLVHRDSDAAPAPKADRMLALALSELYKEKGVEFHHNSLMQGKEFPAETSGLTPELSESGHEVFTSVLGNKYWGDPFTVHTQLANDIVRKAAQGQAAAALAAREAVRRSADRAAAQAAGLGGFAGLGASAASASAPDPPEPFEPVWTGTQCPICAEPQYTCPDGVTCGNSHLNAVAKPVLARIAKPR